MLEDSRHVHAFKMAKDLKPGHIVVDPNNCQRYRVNSVAVRTMFASIELTDSTGFNNTIQSDPWTLFRVLI